MVKTSIVGEEELDEAKSAILADRGSIAEYQARMTEAQLPAREDKIASAEKLVAAQQAALADADWRLSRRQENAPAAGRVEDVFFRAGETANAAQAVVSLLTPDKLKLRFFLPEPELASIKLRQRIAVTCDGCARTLPQRSASSRGRRNSLRLSSTAGRGGRSWCSWWKPDRTTSTSRGIRACRSPSGRCPRKVSDHGPGTNLAIDVAGLIKRFGGKTVVHDRRCRSRAARSAASSAPTAAARPRPSACCAGC